MAALHATVLLKGLTLAASTVQTVVAVQTPTNQAVMIEVISVSFNGSTSTNTPNLIEWGFLTFGTNAPGTNSSAATAQKRDNARTETIQSICGTTWTSEPTVYSILDNQYLADFNGTWTHIIPWYSPIIAKGGNGFGIRVTTGGSTSKVDCSISFQE